MREKLHVRPQQLGPALHIALHDDGEIVLVDVGVVGVDDVLHAFRQPPHDVQLLGEGEAADVQGGFEHASNF